MIRLGIVDDHPVVREGTAALLREQPDIEVVAVAGDPETAVPLLADESLDVVLLDIRLGSASGLHLLSPEHQSPKPAIVVLTAYDYPKYAEAALRLGAAGYVLKSSPFSELLTAIRKAAAGEFAFGVRPSAHARLTPRETAIVSLVVDGRTNDEIAGQLGISRAPLRRISATCSSAWRSDLGPSSQAVPCVRDGSTCRRERRRESGARSTASSGAHCGNRTARLHPRRLRQPFSGTDSDRVCCRRHARTRS